MSSSLQATRGRPSVADWGGGMSASCNRGSNCLLMRAMYGRIVRCGIISSCQSCKRQYNKYSIFTFDLYPVINITYTAGATKFQSLYKNVILYHIYKNKKKKISHIQLGPLRGYTSKDINSFF